MYYSSEHDPNNILTAAYRMRLTEGMSDYPEQMHSTFDPTVVESSPNQLPFIGDYNGSDAYDSVYVGTWTENRPAFTDGEVYAFVSYPKQGSSNSVGKSSIVHGNSFVLSSAFPNPVKEKKFSVSYYLPQSSQVYFEIYNDVGMKVSPSDKGTLEAGAYSKEFDISGLGDGAYTLRMITSGSSSECRFAITR